MPTLALFRLKDYVLYKSEAQSDKSNTTSHLVLLFTSASNLVQGKISYPFESYVTDVFFSEKHQVFFAAVSASKEP